MSFVTDADHGPRTLPQALTRFSYPECSDSRDVLFALVSLDPYFGMIADYHITANAAFCEFAYLLLEKGMLSSILETLREQTLQDKRRVGLPSWVPDLQQKFIDTGTSPMKKEPLEGTIDLHATDPSSSSILMGMHFIGIIASNDEQDEYYQWHDLQWIASTNDQEMTNLESQDGGSQNDCNMRVFLARHVFSATHPVKRISVSLRLIQKGDLICSSLLDWRSQKAAALVLRRHRTGYRIIRVLRTEDYLTFYRRSYPETQWVEVPASLIQHSMTVTIF